MQNILITGGCGFIGSNLIIYLFNKAGFSGKIINVDKLTYAGNPLNLKNIEQKHSDQYVFVHADICDRSQMEKIFDTYEIDTVCHLAAESHVDRSIVAPDEFIQTNIVGTFTLLDIARKRADRLKLFHHVSTDEVFGSLGKEGYFTENTAYSPNSPYSASKAASDHLVRAYAHTYDMPVTISNCSNNYGPYQFPEKLIPLIILNAQQGKQLPVYGDGKNIRDWLYVEDHCSAIWEIMQNGKHGETYAVGGNCEKENMTIINSICDIVDKQIEPLLSGVRRSLIHFVKDRPGHDRRYAIDCSKLCQELGWQPVESLETGLQKTVTWYLNNSEWVNSIQSGQYREWVKQQYGKEFS